MVLVELHPLALEDVFHGHSQNRSKADYYTRHLFLRVLCHELMDDASENGPTHYTQVTDPVLRSASPEPMGNNNELEEPDQKKGSEELTENGGSGDSGLLNRRRKLGTYPLLPTSRADVKPFYHSNQGKTGSYLAKLISNEIAVGIIHLCVFLLHTSFSPAASGPKGA